MNVQTKIMLMLVSTILVLLLSVFGFQLISLRQKNLLSLENRKNQEKLIDYSLKVSDDKYLQMLKDNSAWDDMVRFVKKSLPDSAWAKDNINSVISSYKLSFCKIWKKNYTKIYEYKDSLLSTPTPDIDSTNLSDLLKEEDFVQFFVKTNAGYFKVYAAKIVTSAEYDHRKGGDNGYMIIGKLWNKNVINDLAFASGFKVSIESTYNSDENTQELNKIARTLLDSQRNLIAYLVFESKENTGADLKSLKDLSSILGAASVLVLSIFFILFRKMITQPLKKIINTLRKDDPLLLPQLQGNNNEFGKISSLIKDFFNQKDELKTINEELNTQKEEILFRNKQLEQQKEELQAQAEQISEQHKQLERINLEMKYQTFALDEAALVSITDAKGNITYINQQFLDSSDYTASEVMGKSHNVLKSEIHTEEYYTQMWETIALNKQNWRSEICNKSKNGDYKWFDITIVPFMDEQGTVYQYLSIRFDITESKVAREIMGEVNKELRQQKDEIEHQHKEINASIKYAQRIQNAVLPQISTLKEHFSDHFLYFRPRDIVSGDFFWFAEYNGLFFVAVADCTGHGVPGAFMSMLGMSLLNQIVMELRIDAPNTILEELRTRIKLNLHQTGKREEQKDGMDIALCVIDNQKRQLHFAAANNRAFIFRTQLKELPLEELKADKMPIGVYFGEDKPFKAITHQFDKGDILYLFSDGMTDQFGYPNMEKYKVGRLKLFLEQNSRLENLELVKQEITLQLQKWQGTLSQTDDMTMLALRL